MDTFYNNLMMNNNEQHQQQQLQQQLIDDPLQYQQQQQHANTLFDSSSSSASSSLLSMQNNTNTNVNDYIYYYGDIFQNLNHEYRSIHGYLSLVVCVFGIVANVLNIIVLTRKNMESPTNTILTGVAVSDLLVIASFLPYVIHNYIRTEVPDEHKYNYGWAVFTLFHAHNTVLFHTISIWLTVLLAVWRYFTVRTPLQTRTLLTIKRARLYILLVYLIVPIFCVPVFITFTIHPITAINQYHENISIYTVDTVKLDGRYPDLLEKITFWVFSVFLKLIPCVLLTCITLALIRILIEAKKRKERLLKGRTTTTTIIPTSKSSSAPATSSSTIINSNKNSNNPKVVINISSPNDQRKPNASVLNENVKNEITKSHHHHHHHQHSSSKHHHSKQSKQREISSSSSSTPHTQTESSVGFWRFLYNCTISLMIRKFNQRSTTTTTTTNTMTSLSTSVSSTPSSSSSSSSSSSYVSITPNPQSDQTTMLKVSSQQQIHHQQQQQQHHKSSIHQISTTISSTSSSTSERTTRMLIAVLIMFLICEFPSGILALLSGILGKIFFKNVYNNFGDLMDMLALINSAVNFVLYCLMSQQFRKTFSQLFCIHWTTNESNNPAIDIHHSQHPNFNNNNNNNQSMIHLQSTTTIHSQQRNSCILSLSQLNLNNQHSSTAQRNSIASIEQTLTVNTDNPNPNNKDCDTISKSSINATLAATKNESNSNLLVVTTNSNTAETTTATTTTTTTV